jgi:hypothetical protein
MLHPRYLNFYLSDTVQPHSTYLHFSVWKHTLTSEKILQIRIGPHNT